MKTTVVLALKSKVPYYSFLTRFGLHVIRNRIRMYPAFVNCTTIDWFSEWPQDALLEVAEKYVESMDLGDEEVRNSAPVLILTIFAEFQEISSSILLKSFQLNNYTLGFFHRLKR